jgi:hypothetical protein
MSLDSLLNVLMPPPRPAEAPTAENWIAVENQLGRLPADYKALLGRFGTGSVDRFLWVLNPASVNRHLNLLQQKEPILSALRELRDSGEPSPYPIHPEAGGLLPFGKTDNGDALFWQTVGEPDKWPVVVNAARDPAYEQFECDMTDFLAGVLTRRLRCSVFPEDFPSARPLFTPMPPSQ